MRVLAIGAHPDDIDILCGGTLARYADMGDDVFMAVATNGEVGSPTMGKAEIAAVRKQEAETSAAVIGAKLFWMGFPDEFLMDSPEVRLAFIETIRKCRPDVILTHWPGDLYNPDHTNTGQIANDVALIVTVPNIQTPSPPCEKIPVVYFMDGLAGLGFQPEEYVDISDTIQTKQEMLSKHESQISTWLQDQYQIDAMEMVEITARFRGMQSGVRYAEGFICAKAWPRNITGSMLPR